MTTLKWKRSPDQQVWYCIMRNTIYFSDTNTDFKEADYDYTAAVTRFDLRIPPTLPIPLAEMSSYVERCHSDNNKALYSQFEVNATTV